MTRWLIMILTGRVIGDPSEYSLDDYLYDCFLMFVIVFSINVMMRVL